MTKEEAQKIAEIIRTADGGCSKCVSDLVELFNKAGFGFTMQCRGDIDVWFQPDWTDDRNFGFMECLPDVVVVEAIHEGA